MPREPDVIRAELAELKGKKGQGYKVGSLRMELIESLESEVDRLSAPVTSSVGAQASQSSNLWAATEPDDILGGDPFASDEWLFIEKACGELELDLTRGVTTDLAKKIYNQVCAKVEAWRTMRGIVEEIGIGADWPQWPELGRDPNTGKKVAPKVKAKPDSRESEPTGEGVTDGGMPIREAAPSADDIKNFVMGTDPTPAPQATESIKANVLAEITSRPTPVRKPEPAVAN